MGILILQQDANEFRQPPVSLEEPQSKLRTASLTNIWISDPVLPSLDFWPLENVW